ncbi:MAG TPA: acyltransferase domain-containing protein, partial [Anaerolineaceae bacterium]|nr:acyltransferase domain-containing protein [Anaerolineaceae bacterium]
MSLASDVHFFRSFSHAELEQSMADLALPDELNASLLAYLTQRKDMISLAARAYDESYKDNSGAFDIMRRKPFTRLAIICALLPGLRQRFIDAGIPRQVWLDSIDDIRLRARLYFEKTGKVGLSKNDARWLRHLMGFKLFKIGS